MIVLGLGTNLGDRLHHLRLALAGIKTIQGVTIKQVSPVYLSNAMLPDAAPESWDIPYLNLAVSCETSLQPLALLHEIKQLEKKIGRTAAKHWAPRVVDIDILAWQDHTLTTTELTLPHKGLLERPFALWPLADVAPFWTYPVAGVQYGKTAAELIMAWGSRFTGNCPYQTRQINQRVDTPTLIGIINVTPDSFSDGGNYLAAEAALQQALLLVESGAEILDIGAESTAPNATIISEEEEWSRLEPLLNAIQIAKKNFLIPPKISVDTRHVGVAAKALAYDIDWMNDVTGLENDAMSKLAATSHKDCVVMHHVSIPASKHHVLPPNINVVEYLYDWADKHFASLEKKGIERKKIIFDPGIGFGKTPEQSLDIIKHIQEFKKLGTRILVGHSRKSFMSMFTDHHASDRDVETLVCSLFLANQSVDYLRVHHVEMCARGFRVMKSLE